MSKVKKDALFALIKNLSKSEKWQFVVYSKRMSGDFKIYLNLFNALCSQKIYDEKALLKVNGVKAQQLPNLKSNLYKTLLNYLSQNTKKINDGRPTSYINQAKFLYSKCLYTDSMVIIDKGKQEARSNYQLVALLELLELEKICLLQISGRNISEKVDVLIEEIEKVGHQLNNVNLLSNLSIKLNSYYQTIGFIRNREDLNAVRKYYDDHFPKFNLRQLSVIEQISLYSTITGFYLFIQDFNKAYKYSRKLLNVFEYNDHLISTKTEMYIKAINYVLVCQNKLYKYTDFKETHKKLLILKRNKKLVCNENISLNLFKAIYIHEINKHFMLGEFKQGTRIVAALEKEINQFTSILNKNTIIIFYYKIASLYIGSEQYKIALKWLNKIINEKVHDLREDIQSFSRILQLICYYELNDTQMIEYKIRSTYRFLLQRQNFVKYQLYIMQFLRNMKRTRTKKELMRQFFMLKQNMQRLENNRFEKGAFIYFDIISWLESKLEKRTVQEVVMSKAIQRIEKKDFL